jgi:uncharacterized protein
MSQPRDRLGRPLRGESINSDAFPSVPEREFISGEQAWSEACDYQDHGLPFHAHEVFEQRWRCSPESERTLWQALAQLGAALTHRARGNSSGARTIGLRAQGNLQLVHSVPDYIDLERVRSSLRDLLA